VKVVLDTNVFVSGVFFNGPPFEILQAWRDGKIQLELSFEILEEYRQVGEILAKDHPAIDIQPIFNYVIE
jgi:putative PIN family toxin of toxin-antitoxin system